VVPQERFTIERQHVSQTLKQVVTRATGMNFFSGSTAGGGAAVETRADGMAIGRCARLNNKISHEFISA